MKLQPLDSRSLPWLYALAITTLAPHAEHLPYWLSSVAAGLIAWRVWAWRLKAAMPGRAVVYAMVVCGTASILAEYRTIFGQEAGVALLVLFMTLKLLELNARRDGTVVVMLGYFLLLTHYFYADGILAGTWMLLSLTVVTAALIQLQPTVAGSPAPATLRQAGLLVLQSLPLMLVLFLLFPRVSGPLWGLPQDARKAVTGLSSEMAPGTISELSKSAAIAFRVQFDSPSPPRHSLYWRGPVMSDYDGKTWRVSRMGAQIISDPKIEPRSAAIRYSLTLEPHHQRWLLALDLPVNVPEGANLNATLSLVRQEPLRERLRYLASSAVDYAANAHEQTEILKSALTLPPRLNPRARELANSWRSSTAAADVLVAKALSMFREERFIYTLQPPVLGENAVDDFLFGSRRGFCEHYAAAFVFLMRAAGIPARVVTGYQGGETNPVDGYLVVRQSDAHAWAEVWIERRGWVRVDPTAAIAPSRVEEGIASALPAGDPLPAMIRGDFSWLRGLRYRWEAVNNAWNQWVLGYNAERQQEFLSRIGLPTNWQTLIAALAAGAASVLLLVAAWIMRQGGSTDPAERLWRRFCVQMVRLGIPKMPWEGPRTYGARIATARPQLASPALEASATYERLRYGDASPDDLSVLKAALRRLPSRWKP